MIPCACHLFEEPGKIEEIAKTAAEWFEIYLLGNKKEFENKYAQNKKGFGLFSYIFKDRPRMQIKFKDRVAAGEILASALGKYKDDLDGVTVIGIARGGAVVADAIAEKLAIRDFDIVILTKLRAPNNSENAIGAII